MKPNRYEQYLDISGRVTEKTAGNDFVTLGAICVLPETADEIRTQASSLPKWTDCDLAAALRAAELIDGGTLTALALRVYKTPERWADFWQRAREFRTAIAAETRSPTSFVKAAHIIRYWLFGEGSVRLMAEAINRVGAPTLRDADDLRRIDLRVVCDSDIQGTENIETFQFLWKQFEGKQPLIGTLGLSVQAREVSLETEQNEPLLLLADHLAGAMHCGLGTGTVPRPRGLSATDLLEIRAAYEQLSHCIVVNADFEISYEKIFGGSQVARKLWGSN